MEKDFRLKTILDKKHNGERQDATWKKLMTDGTGTAWKKINRKME